MSKSAEIISSLVDQTGSGSYINGEWLSSASGERFALIDPATEDVTGEMHEASLDDVNQAIVGARHAFDHGPWPRMSPEQRGAFLGELANKLTKHIDLFCDSWTAQVGGPTALAKMMLPGAAKIWQYYAEQAGAFTWEERRKTTLGEVNVVAEPSGVCALIYPWNNPLFTLSFKFAPALMAGCTVVIKPGLEAPFEAMLLAKFAKEIGIPDGVINVVLAGPKASEHLVSHPDVDNVSFTGSTHIGKAIARTCADRMARTSMELGGKSAAVFLDDADLVQSLASVAPWTMPFSGQACLAQTRLLVPESRLEEATAIYCDMIGQAKMGNPWEPDTMMGPVISESQMSRILSVIEAAKKEGAELALGGARAEEFDKGYFIKPTVFTGVTTEMTVAHQEVFGPVLSIMPYKDEEHALAIANSTEYGLHGTVFSQNTDRAIAMARRIRTGSVGVNCFEHDPVAPFGGFKQSGIGREGGPEGLRSYVEYKSIYFQ